MNLAGAFGADFIGDNAVAQGVDFGAEFLPKRFERVCFKAAFEHGVLDAHAPVFADFGDSVEAFGIGDIVGDEGEHLMGAATVAGEFAGGWRVGGKPIGRGDREWRGRGCLGSWVGELGGRGGGQAKAGWQGAVGCTAWAAAGVHGFCGAGTFGGTGPVGGIS